MSIFLIIIFFFLFSLFFRPFSRKIQEETVKYGREYHRKLELNKKETAHLNRLKIPGNDIFFYIDFCMDEVIKLYLSVVRAHPELMKRKIKTKSILEYCIWHVQSEYKYKLSKLPSSESFSTSIDSDIKKLIDTLSIDISPLNKKQEERLYFADSSRWKDKFEVLKTSFQNDSETFFEEVLELSSFNNTYVTVLRSIYYQAHQYLVDKNKALSCLLYIYYLNVKSESTTFKYKRINTKHKKILFKNIEQQKIYEQIVSDFIKTNNFEKTTNAVKELFAIKRRKIILNVDNIQEVKKEHEQVVGILNEYLLDEELEPQVPTETSHTHSNHSLELFDLFVLNDYKLNQKEVDIFAQQKGIFKSQLINNINEQFYEQFEDVLIDEEDDNFVMNTNYYQQIKRNGS